MIATAPTSGGGSIGRRIVLAGQDDGSNTDISAYAIQFAEAITETEAIEDATVNERTGNGYVSYGKDVFTGTGEVVVENFGAHPDAQRPTPIDVVIDGQTIATVAPGETWTIAMDGSASQGGPDLSRFNPKEAGVGNSLSRFLSFVPGILPGLGPLSSSQTTAAAIVVAIAIAGTVLR